MVGSSVNNRWTGFDTITSAPFLHCPEQMASSSNLGSFKCIRHPPDVCVSPQHTRGRCRYRWRWFSWTKCGLWSGVCDGKPTHSQPGIKSRSTPTQGAGGIQALGERQAAGSRTRPVLAFATSAIPCSREYGWRSTRTTFVSTKFTSQYPPRVAHKVTPPIGC
jgi:hypothetical protein